MKYEFTVHKMTCEHCKNRVQNALSAIEGVENVEIDLGTGLVKVKCAEEIGLDVFAAAVEEAGYNFVWDKEDK